MAVLKVGCVLSVDKREDCILFRIDDGFLNVRNCILKLPYNNSVPKIGDGVVYTLDSDEKRIIDIGTILNYLTFISHSKQC